MNLPPSNNDHQLVQFLKTNKPNTPASRPNLESEIMVTIAKVKHDPPKPIWLIYSTIIAASLAATFVTYQWFNPPENNTQIAELENFIESHWNVVNHEEENKWLF